MAPVAFVENTDSYSATTATGAMQYFRGRMFDLDGLVTQTIWVFDKC